MTLEQECFRALHETASDALPGPFRVDERSEQAGMAAFAIEKPTIWSPCTATQMQSSLRRSWRIVSFVMPISAICSTDRWFSKDKRPYNAHLHILWSQPSGGESTPSWFFACAPDMLAVDMGVPMLKGPTLAQYRRMVEQEGEELDEAIKVAGVEFASWGEEPLKKVPAPYTADHEHADLLRRRSLVLDAPITGAWRDDASGLLGAIEERIFRLIPVWAILHRHVSERREA